MSGRMMWGRLTGLTRRHAGRRPTIEVSTAADEEEAIRAVQRQKDKARHPLAILERREARAKAKITLPTIKFGGSGQ